ncbi:MAG: hypothetical protein GY722_23355 [bacterium]|nr:hypothetical protein [bacterium]
MTRPLQSLCGFRPVHLEPGETKAVRFTIGEKQLSMLDANMNRVVEPGVFDVRVGRSSAEYRGTELTVE